MAGNTDWTWFICPAAPLAGYSLVGDPDSVHVFNPMMYDDNTQ